MFCLGTIVAATHGQARNASTNQQQSYRFQHYTIDDGFTARYATGIHQDRHGYLWFWSVESGLCRYDGYSFKTFGYDPADPTSISDNDISAFYEDSAGFHWFGTSSGGLNRYNPATESFTRYQHDVNDSTSIGSDDVQAILEDASGTLWIGTWGGGLNRFDPQTKTFTRFLPDPDSTNSLSSDNVQTLFEDESGTLWVGTWGGGLNRFDPQTETFTRFEYTPRDAHTLSSDDIRSIVQAPDGNLWIGTGNDGLNYFDVATGKATRYFHDLDDPNSLSDNTIQTLFLDESGTLWVGTLNGLNRYNADSTFSHFIVNRAETSAFASPEIQAIYQTRAGRIWAGTNDGLYYYAPLEDTFVAITDPSQTPTGLASGPIRALLEDREGGLWASTFNGVSRTHPSMGAVTRYLPNPSAPTNFALNELGLPVEAPDGTLWYGGQDRLYRFQPRTGTFESFRLNIRLSTEYGAGVRPLAVDQRGDLWLRSTDGLIWFNPSANKTTLISHDPKDPQTLSGTTVTAFLEARDGTIWVGTRRSGLNRLDPATGLFTRYQHIPDDSTSLSDDGVQALLEDTEGNIWIGTRRGGLNRLDPQTSLFTWYQNSDQDSTSLSSNNVQSLLQDASGALWARTSNGGLNRLDPTLGTVTRYEADPSDPQSLSSNQITDIVPASDTTLWIATSDGGLNRLDPRTGAVTRFTTSTSGLLSNTINQIALVSSEELWMITQGGVARLHRPSGTIRPFGAAEGLPGLYFTLYHSQHGRLYLSSSSGGIVRFRPETMRADTLAPVVSLKNMTVLDEDGTDRYTLGVHSEAHHPVVLPHDQNDVIFSYLGFHLKNPEQNRYRYRLEPFESEWQDGGTQRSVRYVSLPPGAYTFHLSAANSDGVWYTEGVQAAFSILPPWWRTNWAYMAYGILITGLLFGADRLQRRRVIRLERERALLREKELRAEAAESRAAFLQIENQRKTQELEVARQLQLSLLPTELPDHPVVSLAAHMDTATEVGGDYYDVLVSEDGTLTLGIGDATGHGAQAGTMVTATKLLFNQLAGEHDPVHVLRHATRALKTMGLPKLYMAFAIAKLQGHTLELAGAGLPHALIYRSGSGQIEKVALKGMPLGSFVDFPYQKTCLDLAPGDSVLLMSDGFPELFNAEGAMFGYDRVVDVFAETGMHSSEAIVSHLKSTIASWSNGHPKNDDVTFVVMKVKGTNGVDTSRV